MSKALHFYRYLKSLGCLFSCRKYLSDFLNYGFNLGYPLGLKPCLRLLCDHLPFVFGILEAVLEEPESHQGEEDAIIC